MGTYVKDGNSCIGCETVKSFPNGCFGCHNLKSNYEILTIICKNKLPKYCTPAQYIEIRKENYPDDGPIWVRTKDDYNWILITYLELAGKWCYKVDANTCIIANTDGKPPSDYRLKETP